MSSARSAVPLLIVALIALAPLVQGIHALSSPNLVWTNRDWVHWPLVVIQMLIWLHAIECGFRPADLVPGFSRPVIGLLLALLAIALATSALRAVSPSFSFLFLAMTLAVWLTATATCRIIEHSGAALPTQLALALFASMLLFLPALLWLLADLQSRPEFDLALGIPGYKNVRRWGFILAAAIAAGSGLLTLPGLRRLQFWAILLGLVTLWTALGWSGTRGGILAVAGAIAIAALVAPSRIRPVALWLVAAALAGLLLSTLIPVTNQSFGIFNAIDRAEVAPIGPDQGVGRIDIWLNALSAVRQAPMFGHGYAQNIWVNPNPIPHTQAHNVIIEALMAWGFVGGSIAVLLAARLWSRAAAITRRTQDPIRLSGFLVVTCLTLFGLVDGSLFYMDSLFMAAIGLALVFAPALPEQRASATEQRPSLQAS